MTVFSSLTQGLAALLALLVAVVGGSSSTPEETEEIFSTTVEEVSAFELVDSIGINVHMRYLNTNYRDSSKVKDLLTDLGVRHLRNDLAPTTTGRAEELAVLKMLGEAGFKLDLILGGNEKAGRIDIVPGQLEVLQQLAPYTAAAEPTNEYDLRNKKNWRAPLHSYSRILYDAVKENPTTAHVEVLSASLGTPENYEVYGSVEGEADSINIHSYSSGAPPESFSAARFPAMASWGGGLPLVVSETGYFDLKKAGGATQDEIASYTVRTLLENLRLGVKRTYLYELLDQKKDGLLFQDPENHFGLVTLDYKPKPAYESLQLLLNTVSDDNPWAVMPASGVENSGTIVAKGSKNLRSLAINKQYGEKIVALWSAVPHGAASETATIELEKPMAATLVDSSTGEESSLGSGDNFALPVNGTVALVKLSPIKE